MRGGGVSVYFFKLSSILNASFFSRFFFLKLLRKMRVCCTFKMNFTGFDRLVIHHSPGVGMRGVGSGY